MDNQIECQSLSPEEKKLQLFLNQKKILDLFLEKMQFHMHNIM